MGGPNYLKKKINLMILEVSRICLGLKLTDRWSTNCLLLQETRLTGKYKIRSCPRGVGRTLVTKHQYKSKSYDFWAWIPDKIQSI